MLLAHLNLDQLRGECPGARVARRSSTREYSSESSTWAAMNGRQFFNWRVNSLGRFGLSEQPHSWLRVKGSSPFLEWTFPFPPLKSSWLRTLILGNQL